jgi:ribosomal protein S18 acetylase RimI-like enzyme
METKRLSFEVKTRPEDAREASGVADAPGSDVYPVARVAPESEVVRKPARSSSLPPPPAGLLQRPVRVPARVPALSPTEPLVAPEPAAAARRSIVTQLELDPALDPDCALRGGTSLRDGVRRADPRDAEVLAAIQVLAREHAFERSLLPRPTELDFDQLAAAWRQRTSPASRARTFLALRSGEPVGFLAAGPGRAGFAWEGEIYGVHVHPRFWSSRVAENLAAAAFDHLVQRGFSVVRVWATVTNLEVLSRLSALGFRPVAQRFHPQHGELEEAFVRRLD